MLLPTIRRNFTPRPEQFGFRSEHSTTLQLSRVLHDITAALNKKEVAAAVFFDIEKAFDRVWHPSFSNGGSTSLSSCRPITAGVPQGTPSLTPDVLRGMMEGLLDGVRESLMGEVMRSVEGMLDAKMAGISDRLLPEPVLRPPLAASDRGPGGPRGF
ncbi:uncharacterized protein LOC123689782 [Pieris rapae]|uniref:uncharacterized protein LOC123689782 n=1 Tax=Pieris rapae TaxID=64459 RepID=UPI001E27D3DE|nr:uncharacterized protein LOC123689782 [Pieris rapae]